MYPRWSLGVSRMDSMMDGVLGYVGWSLASLGSHELHAEVYLCVLLQAHYHLQRCNYVSLPVFLALRPENMLLGSV